LERRAAKLSLLLGLLVLAPIVKAQTIFLDEYVSVGFDEDYDVQEEFVYDGEPNPDPTTLNYGVEGKGTGSGLAHVSYGLNHGTLNLSSGNTSAITDYMFGQVYADSVDRLLISDDALNGTTGTFTATLFIEGTGGLNLSGFENAGEFDVWHAYMEWEALIGIGPQSDLFTSWDGYGGGWYASGNGNEVLYFGDELNTLQTEVSFEFTYGEEFYLWNSLSLAGDYGGFFENSVNGTFDGFIDFGNTSKWGGMRVFDANGIEVTDYQFFSQSGNDWRQPAAVPEPATMAALAVGAVGLLARRRRK
jgi:hypothetical protein